MEAQLQAQSRQHKDELEALHTQIELLKGDIEKKQEMLTYTSSLSPEAKVEYSVQQEITRLTNDNLVRDLAPALDMQTIPRHQMDHVGWFIFSF